ncbi:hypothetical protein [Frankia sp. Cr2]|uniref:hypothetical protein n=1 Tax=Frankia sp. Cr2 TaxID=3073932 RepID=UPI002AD388E7|nr:hypothetical protein [Frankia sp. Cr2]
MQSTSLRDELLAITRAVAEAQRHVRCVRRHAPSSRLASRLEVDVRRVLEDLDDLGAETLSRSETSGPADAGTADGPAEAGTVGTSTCSVYSEGHEPVFVPARQGEPEFQPECDDEGVAGGWQRRRTVSPRRGRRVQV